MNGIEIQDPKGCCKKPDRAKHASPLHGRAQGSENAFYPGGFDRSHKCVCACLIDKVRLQPHIPKLHIFRISEMVPSFRMLNPKPQALTVSLCNFHKVFSISLLLSAARPEEYVAVMQPI